MARALTPLRARQAPVLGDLVVVAVITVLLFAGLRLGLGAPGFIRGPEIRLDLAVLPFYAVRSLGRMGAAYVLSLVFTVVYATLAARNRMAERILLPTLDVLQSVPILSFLPVAVLALTAVLPQRLAIELAAILLIFTSQAWNLTFSYYQSLTTVPKELQEATAVFRLGRRLRLLRLELPFASAGLVWNSVMSWAGGWFFLMAAEIFTVGQDSYSLPGLGAYLHVAADRGDLQALGWGLATLVAMIIALDQLLWRPLLAWTQRFTLSQVGGAEAMARSWFLDSLRRSRLVSAVRTWLEPLRLQLDGWVSRPVREVRPLEAPVSATSSRIWTVVTAVLGAGLTYGLYRSAGMLAQVSSSQWSAIAVGSAATLLRVTIAVAIAVAWTVPVGIMIGHNRRLARFLEPAAEIVASIPATAVFPVLLLLLLHLPAGANLAAVVLMLLGTQWYVLFNVIAAASSLPTDLVQTTDLLGLKGWARWRNLWLPAVFPYAVTGLITASGGAWNASIVAEYVNFGGRVTQVTGLGAVIADATATGDFPWLLAGTLTMIVIVVAVNRLVWRPLYRQAETRFRLDQ